MASSTARAPHAEPLPGPPPTPTSLMDLPAPWRLQLATSSDWDDEGDTVTALFRTCTFFRDTVLQNRTAVAEFKVPLTPARFPAELERLCTVARRSSRVRLEFCGDADEGDHPAAGWMETEPHVTHLLVCAAAQLGGEQPLACVKEVLLHYMEQTALVPAWVRVLCPNATKLLLFTSTFPPLDLPQPSMPHSHLQHLDCRWHYQRPPTAVHVSQQLSPLPSLSSLHLPYLEEEEGEQQAGRLISSTVTRLDLPNVRQPCTLQQLPTDFPCLRELDAEGLNVDDVRLGVLLSMPHLERLHLYRVSLTRSHEHRTWRQPLQLTTFELDVESFARLPLESIQAYSPSTPFVCVHPSTDAAAVARVAAAVRRWGGLASGWCISGRDFTALLTTLGPLITALPAAQQQRVWIGFLRNATSTHVQQLGQQLPPSVTHLELGSCSVAADAWPALLPSLPASVVELRLPYNVTDQQVVAVCQAAVQPIKVVIPGLSQQDLDHIASSLARGAGGSGEQQQQGSLLTLVREEHWAEQY